MARKRYKVGELKNLAEDLVRQVEEKTADLPFNDRYRVFEELRALLGGRLGDMEDEQFERQERRREERPGPA